MLKLCKVVKLLLIPIIAWHRLPWRFRIYQRVVDRVSVLQVVWITGNQILMPFWN